jgi:hypothetical protein
MSAKVKWNFDADYIQACSCDYGCPCEFSAPPTKGFCEGMGAWRIKAGSYGDIKLDGLAMGYAARWPKAIHEGNGTICLFVDERANPKQREALLTIGSGEAGGLPFEILATTFSTVLDPQFVAFQFNINGLKSSFKAGQGLSASLGPILNPVTKEPEQVRVEHSTGFIFKTADCASGDEMSVSAGKLSFSWPGKAAFVTTVQYGN